MIVRKGKSKDLSEAKRKFIFETYYKHIDELALIDIARMLGYDNSVSLCNMRKSKWWNQLKNKTKAS